jgi:branched-chain amino acid transport system permease protein
MDLVSPLISGLALGSMYGLIALGFHITYSVCGALNFAQGSSAMLGAVLAFTLQRTLGWPDGLALPAAIALCALYGLVVERLAVRPFLDRKSDAWLMATVALGLVIDNAVMFLFGTEPRSLSSSLTQAPIMLGGFSLGVYPLHILIPLVGLATAGALHLVSRKTLWGTALLAVAQNRDAASLMGIPVKAMIAAAFAASSALAGLAGMMIAPLFNIQSDMGVVLGLKAFAVAILGGLRNPWGVMAAGILFGISEAVISASLGSGYTQILTFSLVILALALRPDGLLGKAQVRKV